jgi:uncharacterized protein (UPF0276 family)
LSASPQAGARPLPVAMRSGIGLRPGHYREVLASLPDVGFLEVHSENYFGDGGAPLHYLQRAGEHYPISLHGTGLSLGSTDPLNTDHLRKLKQLVERFDPLLVSDHLCWNSYQGVYLNDLLPLPYTEESLNNFVQRVDAVQDFIGRQLLIENPSDYLQYKHSRIPETEFLAEIGRRTGCRLLLDINNVYVSAVNLGFDAQHYIDALPANLVAEYHLAGHTVRELPEATILIDTHDGPVSEPVWQLYEYAIRGIGLRPTLIEWDARLPELDVLLSESGRADRICGQVQHVA